MRPIQMNQIPRGLRIPAIACGLALAVVLAAPAARAGSGADEDRERTVRIEVRKGAWLGVGLEGLEPQDGERPGVRIVRVFEGSPAETAGLKAGDLVIALGGQPTGGVRELTGALKDRNPGDRLTVRVLRDGAERNIEVTLGERKPGQMQFENIREIVAEAMPGLEGIDLSGLERLEGLSLPDLRIMALGGHPDVYVGITMQDLTDDLREFFGATDGRGFLVSSVRADSPAAGAGLRAGDVIIAADGERVADPSDLTRLLRDRKAGDPLELTIVRDRREQIVALTLAKRPEGFGSRVFTWHEGPEGDEEGERVIRRLHVRGEENLDARIEALQKRIEELTRRLEELSAQAERKKN